METDAGIIGIETQPTGLSGEVQHIASRDSRQVRFETAAVPGVPFDLPGRGD
jgi:hypothetical protein